jgi:hypothetical protein
MESSFTNVKAETPANQQPPPYNTAQEGVQMQRNLNGKLRIKS